MKTERGLVGSFAALTIKALGGGRRVLTCPAHSSTCGQPLPRVGRILLCAIVLLPSASFAGVGPAEAAIVPSAVLIDRVMGTPVEVAVAFSESEYASGADTVVIASTASYADQLGAAALCGALDAPLLLTQSGSLDGTTAAEISRLGATAAYILGGTLAVSSSVQSEIESMGLSVVRLAGQTRYDTAVAVAEEARSLSGTLSATAFIVGGLDANGAALAAPYAAGNGIPILLTMNYGLPAVTLNALASLGITEVVIVGDTEQVSPAVETALGVLLGEGNVVRWSSGWGVGESAYEVVQAAKALGWVAEADYVVCDPYENPITMLACGAAAGARGGALLFTEEGLGLPDSAISMLRGEKTAGALRRISLVSADAASGSMTYDQLVYELSDPAIAGRIVDEQGEPVQGVHVDAYRLDGAEWVQEEIGDYTDDAGGYGLVLTEPATYTVYAHDMGGQYAPRFLGNARTAEQADGVWIPADGSTFAAEDILLPAAGRIQGTVSTADGSPITHMWVGAYRESAPSVWEYIPSAFVEYVGDSMSPSSVPFEIGGLDDGLHRLEVSVNGTTVFYHHAPNLDQATDVPVVLGQVTSDIDCIVGENTPPTSTADAYETAAGTELVVSAPGVLQNDLDADLDELSTSLENDVAHGVLDLSADGGFTYSPNPGFTGNDTFTYRAFDGFTYSDIATVTVTVTDAEPPTGTMQIAGGAAYVGPTFSIDSSVTGATEMQIRASRDGIDWGGGPDWIMYDPSVEMSVGEGGVWYYRVEYRDQADNRLVLIDDVIVDAIEPVTTGGPSASYVDSAAIALVASDEGGADLGETYYILDGGQVQVYSTPINVTGYGEHVLEFWSQDAVGNEETHHVVSFSIVSDGADSVPIAGSDRFSTSIMISQRAFPDGLDPEGKRTVVIATGRNWPDALGGSALAGALDGPILLVDTNSVPASVTAEITRLGAAKAIVLGGTGALGTDVETALKTQLGFLNVERIAGGDRYITADLIADRTKTELGGDWDGTAFVATGGKFADALAAAPLSAGLHWPLYLSHPLSGLSAATKAEMADSDTIVILGGTGAVPASVETYLNSVFGDADVDRLAGADRYDTAVQVAQYGVDAGLHWDGVAVATGKNYPDALSGGVLQGRGGSVMVLTDPFLLNGYVRTKLTVVKAQIGEVRFLGGPGAVSQAVRTEVMNALE